MCFFVNNCIEIDLLLPDAQELLQFDKEALLVFPDSLQHYIWISLNKELDELKYSPFQNLQYSVKNFSNCEPETLSLLDIEAFLYCATLCAKVHLKDSNRTLSYNEDKPKVLPVFLTERLGSIEQEKFLTAAYKICHKEDDCAVGEMRVILIRGLETVRCIGRHCIGLSLLVKLAEVFQRKSEKSIKQSVVEFNDARAELYWKSAVSLLDKSKNHHFPAQPANRLFEYEEEMPLSEIHCKIDNGKLFLGNMALKRKEYEEALKMFQESKDPFATFRQAETYKQMAHGCLYPSKGSVTIEMKNHGVVLITKARDCLYSTLERLQVSSVDRNHPLNGKLGKEIDQVERLLVELDSHHNDRNECDRTSDENTSSDDDEEYHTFEEEKDQFENISNPQYHIQHDMKNIQSTVSRLNMSKRDVKPTPERLNAQLKQLYIIKDVTTSKVLEQTRIVLESHRSLVGELKGFKEAVRELSAQVDAWKNVKSGLEDLKDVKKSVDRMGNSVRELQGLRDVSDLVHELRTEIAEMKKDGKTDNRRRKVNFNQPLYQNYPSRVSPLMAAQTSMYPLGFHPAFYATMTPYGYPNLGFQQPGLPFGTPHQPDFRARSSTLFPTQSHVQPQLVPVPVQPPLNQASSGVNAPLLTSHNSPQNTSHINLFEKTISSGVSTSATSTKSTPMNVVITSSDPLPTLNASSSQSVFPVTVSPRHIKGNLHEPRLKNNQESAANRADPNKSVFPKPASTVASEGVQANKLLIDRECLSKDDEEYCGNAEASVSFPNGYPLFEFPPDDISPNEVKLFERPATLFLFDKASNEFQVEGSGLFQILKDKDKDTSRIFMKDEHGRNIANYYISIDFKIASAKNNSFYYYYLFSSKGKLLDGKFCLQFVNSVDAAQFYKVYEQCKQKLGGVNLSIPYLVKKPEQSEIVPTGQGHKEFDDSILTYRPTVKPKEEAVFKEVSLDKETRNLFANFTFDTGNNCNTPLEVKPSKVKTSLLASILSTSSEVARPKPLDNSQPADSSPADEFVPSVEFQPAIPLPGMVEVKTGEENAEVLFNCRTKLLRFDSEKKEWKERGLGNMKILREKRRIRLLMRREHIFKVCCNHQLLKNMKFRYMPDNYKALTWCAQDYADEVLKAETFAVRFKTEEQAGDFLECILSAQRTLEDGKETRKEVSISSELSQGFGDTFKVSEGTPGAPIQGLGQDSSSNEEEPPVLPETSSGILFEPKAGTWECRCCLVMNDAEVPYCVSCKFPNSVSRTKKESTQTITGINLKIPFKSSFGVGDGPLTTTQGFSDAFASPSSSPVVTGFSNASYIIRSPPDASGASKETGNSVAHACETLPKSPGKSTGNEKGKWSYVENLDNTHLKQVEETIEYESEENSERVVFRCRAKLSEFVDDEWKERGAGELKIFMAEPHGDLRVSMRKDPEQKICLNHELTLNVEYLPKDDIAWLFNAADNSNGEMTYGKFCLNFGNADDAKEFKAAASKSLKATQSNKQQLDSDDGSEIEFVEETCVTAEEIKETQRLNLPPKFFAYKQLPLCTCDQCAKDDEYFKGTLLENNSSKEASVSTPTGEDPDCTISSGSDVFLTPCSFDEPPKYETLRDLLAKPPILSRSATTQKIMEKTDTPISSSITTAGNLFGSKFVACTNLFGAKLAPADDSAYKSFSFTAKQPEGCSATSSVSSGTLMSAKNTVGTEARVFDEKSDPILFGGRSTDTKNLFDTSDLKTFFGSGTSACSSLSITSDVFDSSTNASNNFRGDSSITTTAESISGSNTSTTASVFGSIPIETSDQDGTTLSKVNASQFGAINTGKMFGNINASSLGSGAKYEFGKGGSTLDQPKEDTKFSISDNRRETTKTSKLKEDDEVILKCSSDVSFSSLAQQSQNVSTTFRRSTEGGGDVQPFSFLGAGSPVFGTKNKQTPDPRSQVSQEECYQGPDADDEYDPHYEPIIPLPEAITVSTGEEEETAVFDERAKLFRYDPDSKEWKERGVGQMKILHHPDSGTYRFLLRREQVHKIVLNQLVTPSLNVQPMTTSDRACMWAGHNYVDEQMNLEKLAVRFKYSETSEKFIDTVQICLSVLEKTQNANLPSNNRNNGLGYISSDSNPQDESSYEKDGNYYSYDEDDD